MPNYYNIIGECEHLSLQNKSSTLKMRNVHTEHIIT